MTIIDRIKRLFEPEEEPAYFEMNYQATFEQQDRLIKDYLDRYEKLTKENRELKKIIRDQIQYIGVLIDKEEKKK